MDEQARLKAVSQPPQSKTQAPWGQIEGFLIAETPAPLGLWQPADGKYREKCSTTPSNSVNSWHETGKNSAEAQFWSLLSGRWLDVMSVHPLFACGSIGITDAQWTLFLIILALWLISIALVIANIFMFCVRPRHVRWHICISLSYIGWGLALFLGWFPNLSASQSAAFAVSLAPPLLVIGQFILLLFTRQREREAKAGI